MPWGTVFMLWHIATVSPYSLQNHQPFHIRLHTSVGSLCRLVYLACTWLSCRWGQRHYLLWYLWWGRTADRAPHPPPPPNPCEACSPLIARNGTCAGLGCRCTLHVNVVCGTAAKCVLYLSVCVLCYLQCAQSVTGWLRSVPCAGSEQGVSQNVTRDTGSKQVSTPWHSTSWTGKSLDASWPRSGRPSGVVNLANPASLFTLLFCQCVRLSDALIRHLTLDIED